MSNDESFEASEESLDIPDPESAAAMEEIAKLVPAAPSGFTGPAQDATPTVPAIDPEMSFEGPPPRAFEHCVDLYNVMMRTAKPVREYDRPVFEANMPGGLSTLCNEQVSSGGYSKITNKLIAMGCIEKLRTGAGPVSALWLMLQEPTIELFHVMPDRPGGQPKTNKAAQAQQIRDLNKRISTLERDVRTLTRTMRRIMEGAN